MERSHGHVNLGVEPEGASCFRLQLLHRWLVLAFFEKFEKSWDDAVFRAIVCAVLKLTVPTVMDKKDPCTWRYWHARTTLPSSTSGAMSKAA